MSPKDRWEKLKKGRMCFSCLEPRGVRKLRAFENHINVPKALKCSQCALWSEPNSLAPFSFFCKWKEHGESRASPSEIKDALESYIGRLEKRIVEANILVAVNFMFKANSTIEERRNLEEYGHAVKMFPQTPVIDSETGYRVMCENTAVGMDNVTSGFGEYNLEEVIREYRETASGDELEYILPQTVGRVKVHMLLGIKIQKSIQLF